MEPTRFRYTIYLTDGTADEYILDTERGDDSDNDAVGIVVTRASEGTFFYPWAQVRKVVREAL